MSIQRKATTIFVIVLLLGGIALGAGLYLRMVNRPIPPLVVPLVVPPEQPGPVVLRKLPSFRTLSPDQRAHILDGEFSVEKDIDSLPAALKQEFSQLAREQYFDMANPGAKYQKYDVVIERLPFRRLVFAGISNDKAFIHYESGGLAHSYQIVVFRAGLEGGVEFLWGGGAGQRGAKDLGQLRSLIASGGFAYEPAHTW